MKTQKNKRIQIGIVTAPMPNSHLTRAPSYLDKDYITWVEMSGANALLIPYNTASIEHYLDLVQGIVWVGGAIENTKTHSNQQYKTLIAIFKKIFSYAVKENDKGNYFPLWGTCLGFELLAMMGENYKDGYFTHLQHAEKYELGPLMFVGKSKIRQAVPVKLQEKIAVSPVVNHIHNYGFDLKNPHTKTMKEYLKIVSVDIAENGVKFMNMFEYKKYPFYGCQWHPEKPLTHLGVELSHTLSLFLKRECSKNKTFIPKWSKITTSGHFNSKFGILLKG